MSEVTRILTAIEQGDAQTSEELLPLVYHKLRRMAAHKMASEPAAHPLQPTALVHEAWLKLVDTPNQSWQKRAPSFEEIAAAEAKPGDAGNPSPPDRRTIDPVSK